VNGRLWATLDATTKSAFLLGMSDGMYFGSIFTGATEYAKVPEALKFPDLTRQEVSKELDLFYAEGANGPVPIVHALRYVRRKAKGDTVEQLQELLSSLRRGASK